MSISQEWISRRVTGVQLRALRPRAVELQALRLRPAVGGPQSACKPIMRMIISA